MLRHKGMEQAVNTFSERAGCVARRPKTHHLLLGQFTPAECAALFQKTPTKAQQAEIRALLGERERLRDMPAGPERDRQREVLQQRCRLMVRDTSGGLEVDNHITDPISSQEIIVDVTCIHPTCKKRLPLEFNHTFKARAKNGYDPLCKTQGAALTAQSAHKHAKYAPLLAVMLKQKASRLRSHVPRFFAACISTHGELGKETIQLTEWLTSAYSRRLEREADDDDGISRATKTARFQKDKQKCF